MLGRKVALWATAPGKKNKTEETGFKKFLVVVQ
jgi:hypothetical protein